MLATWLWTPPTVMYFHSTDMDAKFKVGDKVSKVGGDYTFEGTVVAVFTKLSGAIRLVVEDDRGVLHVYSEKNLTAR
jgi:hypothetical protein